MRQVLDLFAYENILSGSLKGIKFPDSLRDNLFLKIGSVAWSFETGDHN